MKLKGRYIFLIVILFTSLSYSYKRLPLRTSASRLNLIEPNIFDPAITNIIIPNLIQIIPSGFGIFAPLLSTDSAFLGFFRILDVAQSSLLPGQTRTFLSTFPVIARMGLGFLTIDVLPAVADVLLLRIIWSKVIAVRPESKDIDISTLPTYYDVDKIGLFYNSKPRLVLARATEILILAKDFLFGLFQDYQSDALKTNQPIRAIQFTELITTLGPTFIKVGQALSIRPDLASPAYLEELVKLQDQVPPFSSKIALQIVEKELSPVKLEDIFENLSDFNKPVAAASLGQVYKAHLKGSGVAVAVKVQRPDMMLAVTLDLYIVRNLFVLGQMIPKIAEECKGLVSVVDNWAGRFQDELGYFIISLICNICSFLIFVWLFFIIYIGYVSYVEDRLTPLVCYSCLSKQHH